MRLEQDFPEGFRAFRIRFELESPARVRSPVFPRGNSGRADRKNGSGGNPGDFLEAGLISEPEKDVIVSSAAQSECGSRR